MNKGLLVLVVEDEVLLLKAISKKLELNNIRCKACLSAAEALTYLQSASTLPDIVWLDYYLEDMNGMEFVQILRKNKSWTKIPVMVVSNSASDEKVHAMEMLGVKKYILKAEHGPSEVIKDLQDFVADTKKSYGETAI